LHTTVIEFWLLSSTNDAGVVTTLVPMAGEFKVHWAPTTPGVAKTIGCVVPFVIVAHAPTKIAKMATKMSFMIDPP
jgi:hypothetical protein